MMRLQLVMGFLSVFVSMGLVVVIINQHKDLATVEKESELAQEDLDSANDQASNKNLLIVSVKNLHKEGKKVLGELEASLPELEKKLEEGKKAEEACKAEKQTKTDELAQKEKERADAEAPLKTESDAWKQEIAKLKEQLMAIPPICAFVKDNKAGKLCELGDHVTKAA